MSYTRVIPRDLFNEANLLKCLGRIYINLETANVPNVELDHDGEAFDVQMDENSGALYASNVTLMVRGDPCRLVRPLNSREAWPLKMVDEQDEEIDVFSEDGSFSAEMLAFLRGESEAEKARA
jgi:hypothetical protein